MNKNYSDEISFEAYSQQMYPSAADSISKSILAGSASLLLTEALRLSYLLEMKKITLLATSAQQFLTILLVQIAQELHALYSTAVGGSLLGCAHHTRAVMEMYAMANFVAGKPTKRERRLEKFSEFRLLAIYKHHHLLEKALDEGAITLEEFQAKNKAQPADLGKVDAQKIKKWLDLYKPKNDDITKVTNWHSPATIESLLSETHLKADFKELYGHLCHLTHLSPLSSGVNRGALIVQPSQIEQVERFISIARTSFWYTLVAIDDWLCTAFRQNFSDMEKNLTKLFTGI